MRGKGHRLSNEDFEFFEFAQAKLQEKSLKVHIFFLN